MYRYRTSLPNVPFTPHGRIAISLSKSRVNSAKHVTTGNYI